MEGAIVGPRQYCQIGRLDRARTVVLLTAGILEEHGPFLPSYSDGYQSEFIATRVADAIAARSKWTVLRFPEIPLGIPGELRRRKVCVSRELPCPHDDGASGLYCLLFLRPDLVAPAIRSAPAVGSRDFSELVATAQSRGGRVTSALRQSPHMKLGFAP